MNSFSKQTQIPKKCSFRISWFKKLYRWHFKKLIKYVIDFFSNGDGLVTREDIMMEIAFDQNNDGMISEEEANFYLSGQQSYTSQVL